MATQTRRPDTASEPTFVQRREGDTYVNAIIGAVASVVLSFTGVGIVLGGAVAGYLQNEGTTVGAKVGAISGVIASIPALAVFGFAFGGIGLFGLGGGELGLGLAVGGLMLFAFAFVVLGVVGMAALGGYVGGALAERNDG